MAASANTEIANAVAATQALSRLDSMIEDNGSGQFRFDTIAVSMVVGGGGQGGAVNITVEDRSITVT
jgi:acetyl-CoA carboxylase alpha subunit